MKKFFKKEKNFKKEEESLWLNVNLYWKLAVIFMFLGAFCSFFFGYYLFTQINKEPVMSSSNPINQIKTVKKEAINKELQYFSEREKKSAGIINSPSI